MAGANVKIGVSGVSQFKSDVGKAEEAIKTFKEQLNLCEKELKETGKQEDYLKKKAGLLAGKLNAEEQAVADLEKALKSMRDQGIDRASKSYQNMYRKMLRAKSAASETRTQINYLKNSEAKAGEKAETLSEKLKSIGDGVGWDNVSEGIGKITDKLMDGARAAVNLGKKIIQSAKGSTELADEIKTTVDQYSDMGLTADSYQRMSKVAEFVDTPVEAILNARQRMNAALAKDKGKKSLEETLGIKLQGQTGEDLFWETGEALIHMGEGFDKEEAAQTLFGRSWRELAPLFKTGREQYEKMLEEQNVLTDDQVEKLAQADDAIKSVEQEIALLKAQFWAENADTITTVLQWLVDNKEPVIGAITAFGAVIGGLKLAEAAANVGKIVSGIKLLTGGGAAGAAGAAGASGAGTAGATTAAGLGWAGWAGLAGAVGIGAGFAAAANARNNHPETVRGTNEYLAAQGAGNEILLANYLKAMQAQSALDWSASEADVAAITARVQETYQKLQEAEGGAEALQAYSDWRQEHSYGNNYWELPDTLAQAVQELTGGADKQAQSNSEMALAAQGLQGLPAQIANAMSNALSGIGITIDGQTLLGYVNNGLATQVNP